MSPPAAGADGAARIAAADLDLLRASFRTAVAAADPLHIVAAHLPAPPRGRTLVVGAGKAAASTALAVEQAWPEVALEGLVVTRYGHGLPTTRIRVVEAGHPVPDAAGRAAAEEILERAGSLGPDDLLLALISGGGSALLNLPSDGLTVADLRATTAELLRCGAPIEQMNVVRKHLSRVQGGRLAAAAAAGGARVCALIVSDVTGDDPADIASGPCAPDPSTYGDALEVLARHRCAVPPAVRARLEAGAAGRHPETPKPGDPVFVPVTNRVIATARGSLQAAAAHLRAAGVVPLLLGDTVTGEAREVAQVIAALVREVRHGEGLFAPGGPLAPPLALISGGECTVTLPAAAAGRSAAADAGKPGPRPRGGRCTEFLLALADALGPLPGVYALAADTDGIDGSEDNAGAVLDPGTLERAAAAGFPARACLDAHDAYGFFAATGGLLVTGPTRTNVNDYRVVLIR